jgi:Spermine/spermidine synthase domain
MQFVTVRAPKLTDASVYPVYLSVGLIAGAIITLQVCIAEVFAIASWAHFGSLVVSVAMLAFGLVSTVMCIHTTVFQKYHTTVAGSALLAFGPFLITSNFIAQHVPFNPIFLASDPLQKWYLATRFLLYMLPFAAGALFLGSIFLRAQSLFARLYFADLFGSGLCALLLLWTTPLLSPENLLLTPLLLWLAACAAWACSLGYTRWLVAALCAGLFSLLLQLGLPRFFDIRPLVYSDFKGVSYVRNLPDTRHLYAAMSNYGNIEVYTSSYLHFAPGLSDNAAFNIPKFPANVFAGLYVNGDGPLGIVRRLNSEESEYFRYLPMYYPYLLQKAPRTLVVQFGGGLSTALALRSGATNVTIAEPNSAIVGAFLSDAHLSEFTGGILSDARVRVVQDDARWHLARTGAKYDVIDLSLADSTGLSNPGGFAIVEKYAYSREAFEAYMRALNEGGILSVTVWNREEPPKSLLKLYATIGAAARSVGVRPLAESFYVVSNYLSTATVLYRKGGFSAEEIGLLRRHSAELSFDEVYFPGLRAEQDAARRALESYRRQIFPDSADRGPNGANDVVSDSEGNPPLPPAMAIGQAAWHALLDGNWAELEKSYVFDVRQLTDARPYFAAYIKVADLPHVIGQLALVQDEWGYLVIWVTFGLACVVAAVLILIPAIFSWLPLARRTPGKAGTVLFFACIGLGYIVAEVGFISYFMRVLSSPTLSILLLLPCLLIPSGLGSLISERVVGNAPKRILYLLTCVAALLMGCAAMMGPILDWIGRQPHALRYVLSAALILPPAFLMGFPMPTAMRTLARLGKEDMYIWGWGINGCFSVVGAALVPLVATSYGLTSVLVIAGCAYVLAVPTFLALLAPVARNDGGP